MTAATTSVNKNKSSFCIRFKSKFSEDTKLFVTNLVFHLLCVPVLAGVLLKEMYMEQINDYRGSQDMLPFIAIAVIAFILSIAMGFVIPMMNFRYLYNKSLVDMNYSLPLNNRQRFFADYFSGLIAYIAPPLVGAVIGGTELLIGSFFIDISELYEIIPMLLRIGFVVIVGMIMLYTLSVLAITFAGSTFEALFSIAAVNIMIPAFLSLTWMNIVNAAGFGLSEEAITNSFTLFTTSPLGVMFFIAFSSEKWFMSARRAYSERFEYTTSFINSVYFSFMVRALLFIAVIVLIAYLLYKHRKAEDVSKPYVYKAFYYVLMATAVYCIFSVMKMTDTSSAFIAAFIISGILWFVMEVIRRRGFKRFWTAVVSFAAASAAVIGVIQLTDITNGFGRAKFTPSASSVTDVEINVYGRYDSLYEDRLMHDKKVIKDAVEFNKEIVDRHYNPEKYDYELLRYRDSANGITNEGYVLDITNIDIVFYTRSGASISRNYQVPSEMLTDLLCDMYTSEEYAEQVTEDMFRKSLVKDNNNYGYGISPEEAQHCRFEICDKLGVYTNIYFSVEEGRALADAVRTDIAAMTADDLKNSDNYCYLEGIIINSACHNTVAFLEEHDIVYNKTAEKLVAEMTSDGKDISFRTEPDYIFPLLLFTDNNNGNNYDRYRYESSVNDGVKLDYILNFSVNSNRSSGKYGYNATGYYTVNDTEAVEKLLEIATPVVLGEKVIGEVQYGNSTLYVTDRPGYSEIFNKAKGALSWHSGRA